jgi:sortase A
MKLATYSMFFAGLAAGSVWQAGKAAYLQAKASLSRRLLHAAWERSLGQREGSKPWPWADTWPLARLHVPRLHAGLLVLSGETGGNVAFGPGHIAGTALPGERGNCVLSGHRDTHFAFLRELRPGDLLTLQAASGMLVEYRVATAEVVHRKDVRVLLDAGDTRLTLITCYPFDSPLPGGALRYAVVAVKSAGRTLEI